MKVSPKETVAFTEDSNYSRVGYTLVGNYLDQVVVRGIVTESRVKYGGNVQHTIVLEYDVQMPWGEYKMKGDHLLITEDEIVTIIIED